MTQPTTPPATTPVVVSGLDLVLRAWDAADATRVAMAAQDPAIKLWNPLLPAGTALSEESAHAWCTRRADWSDGTHASWAVVTPDDEDRVIGSVSLHRIDVGQRGAEVGFWVTPDSRGRGVATRALSLAAGFGFGSLDLLRIALFHAVENDASCRVATANGFTNEGLHRRSYRCGDGQWHDEHSHARLCSDPDPG